MKYQDVLSQQLKLHSGLVWDDIYKLMFQAEFGPGHIISDEQKAWERFNDEYESIIYDCEQALYRGIKFPLINLPLAEPISNRYCRINFWPHKVRTLNKIQLFEMFLETARTNNGSIEGLKQRIEEFLILQEQIEICNPTIVEVSLMTLEALNYPPLHHSDIYKSRNNPAYRVISRQLWEQK